MILYFSFRLSDCSDDKIEEILFFKLNEAENISSDGDIVDKLKMTFRVDRRANSKLFLISICYFRSISFQNNRKMEIITTMENWSS